MKTPKSFEKPLKGGYPIIFESNVFHKSRLIQKCIQNQQGIPSAAVADFVYTSESNESCEKHSTQRL
jgi:hypothetical protein